MGADDVDADYRAVMGARERLWAIYGEAWGWPPATMTLEEDRDDLARHARETEAHESFLYGIFDATDDAFFGCVYIDPPEREGEDAVVSWWVVEASVGSELERTLDAFVPSWITGTWNLGDARFGVSTGWPPDIV
jgi:hypothetical protein